MNKKINQFVMVSEESWQQLISKLDAIESSLGTKASRSPIGEYVTEKEAKQILGKSTTWFWNKRKSRELRGKKSGNVWYYKIRDLQKFIENGVSN
jgi:hypothetical protein